MAVNKGNFSEVSLDNLVKVLRDLSSSDDELADAARWLRELGDTRATEPVLRRLVNQLDPPWIRRELIVTLGSLVLLANSDSPEVRDLFLRILKSSSEGEEARSAAALNLGFLGDTRAVGSLLKILKSDELGLSLMYSCVQALGEIRDLQAMDPLVGLLKADRPFIPQAVAEALGKFGAAAERVLPALQKLVERGNDTERRFALEAIAKIEQGVLSRS